jgi:hypothetical protein
MDTSPLCMRIGVELDAVARRTGGTQLCALLRDGWHEAHTSTRTRDILKRQLVHVGAFNLSLILRKVLGAGTPRQWKDLEGTRFLLFIYYLLVGKTKSALRKPNLNTLYEIGHRITKLDSQLGAAGRAEK